MIDSAKLIDQLSDIYEISEETQNVLLTKSTIESDAQAAKIAPSNVGLVYTVSTFVAQKNFHNFVVPPFAAHWGVVCDFAPDVRYLFHLLFNANTREVIFEGITWKTEWSKHQVSSVGTTRYDIIQVSRMGQNLCL